MHFIGFSQTKSTCSYQLRRKIPLNILNTSTVFLNSAPIAKMLVVNCDGFNGITDNSFSAIFPSQHDVDASAQCGGV